MFIMLFNCILFFGYKWFMFLNPWIYVLLSWLCLFVVFLCCYFVTVWNSTKDKQLCVRINTNVDFMVILFILTPFEEIFCYFILITTIPYAIICILWFRQHNFCAIPSIIYSWIFFLKWSLATMQIQINISFLLKLYTSEHI